MIYIISFSCCVTIAHAHNRNTRESPKGALIDAYPILGNSKQSSLKSRSLVSSPRIEVIALYFGRRKLAFICGYWAGLALLKFQSLILPFRERRITIVTPHIRRHMSFSVPENVLESAQRSLEGFLSSESDFTVVLTVPSSPDSWSTKHIPPSELLILDSSFNPPSKAHQSLCSSALQPSQGKHDPGHLGSRNAGQLAWGYEDPKRILLLFSTHNAEKQSVSPASFDQRLAMMILFAADLAEIFSRDRWHKEASIEQGPTSQAATSPGVFIDIGLTTQPFYADKSAAVDASGAYHGQYTASDSPRQAKHVHLAGSDTFVRILDPKYYAGHNPPLSALDQFFNNHALRVMARGAEERTHQDESDDESSILLQRIQRGELEAVGGRKAWADRIELVQAQDETVGVSSTRIREAVKSNDWNQIGQLCTPRVCQWIKAQSLYQD